MKRRSRLLALLLTVLVLLSACTPGRPQLPEFPPNQPPPPKDGLMDRRAWGQRQEAYLKHATARWDASSLDTVYAGLARERIDGSYRSSAQWVSEKSLEQSLRKIDAMEDTSDFDLMRVYSVWRLGRGRLSPPVQTALTDRLLNFRYWYTDPQVPGRTDHKWFWSENHRLIMHTMEYLAGLGLPEATFAVTGQKGTVHADRGRERVLRWLDDKARWGFSEWHSDVYYAEDIEPLLLLAEYGEPEVKARAIAMLDVFFHDLAVHQVHGNMGSTHGRSYMKDKTRAADQDVSVLIDFLYGKDDDWRPYADYATTLLAASTTYRLPVVLQEIASDPAPMVDREKLSVPLNPASEVSPNPTPPPGTSFTDDYAVEFWWDRGAFTTWQLAPLTIETVRRYELWRSDMFAPVKDLVSKSNWDPRLAAYVARATHCQLNPGLLSEANTVTYRGQGVMLSSVQDYRPGCVGRQYHAWQATLGEDAVVFTTHPGNPDRGAWADDDLYWNGGTTMPRSAQQGAAVVNIYAPAFASSFEKNYLEKTHAFFPTQNFDQIERSNGWTFGRKGDRYVALYSWRPTQWAQAGRNPNGLTKPYDLVANGGADNVWISEVGTIEKWGSFANFMDAVANAKVEVVDKGKDFQGVSEGLSVTYESPTEGQLAFGTVGGFFVKGIDTPLRFENRVDSPYAKVAAGDPKWTISNGRATLRVDLATGAREAVMN